MRDHFSTDRRRQSVQITSVDSNEQAYFNRIAEIQRRPYFPAQQKRLNRDTGQVQPIGRALETPTGIVHKRALAVCMAIERKVHDSSGTDILLIAAEAPVRPKRLLPAVKTRTDRFSRADFTHNSICLQFGARSFGEVRKPLPERHPYLPGVHSFGWVGEPTRTENVEKT